MPVSGEPGLILKRAGCSANLREREPDPVGASRTARPGPSSIPGPPIALASIMACRDGRPGRILKRRTGVSDLLSNCHFVTVPISTTVGAHRDLLSRSGKEILT
jgi:hypothetical protein